VEAKPLLAAILTAEDTDRETLDGDITESIFNNYVTTVNASISPFDLEIRSVWTQTSPRTRIYALVNTTSDAITQLATTHTPDEIAFVKRLLDEIFDRNNTVTRELIAVPLMRARQLHKSDGPNRRVSGADGEQGGAAAASLTMDHAEKLLDSLVSEGWLEKSRRDYFTLSPRALMELRGWLLETYNEPPEEEDDEGGGVERVKLCQACREIVTVGERCATRVCPCRLHEHCTQVLFKAQRGSNKCPLCKVEWTGQEFVGEKAANAVSRGAAGDAGRQRVSNGAGASSLDNNRRRPSQAERNSSDEEEDD